MPVNHVLRFAKTRWMMGKNPTHRQTLPLGGVCVNRTSMLQTFGAASSKFSSRIVDLPLEVSSLFVTDVRPREALPSLEQLRVRIALPLRERIMQGPLFMPDQCRVPRSATIEPNCILKRNAPWKLKRDSGPILIDREKHDFLLELEPTTLVQWPPDQRNFQIRLVEQRTGSIVPLDHNEDPRLTTRPLTALPVATTLDQRDSIVSYFRNSPVEGLSF